MLTSLTCQTCDPAPYTGWTTLNINANDTHIQNSTVKDMELKRSQLCLQGEQLITSANNSQIYEAIAIGTCSRSGASRACKASSSSLAASAAASSSSSSTFTVAASSGGSPRGTP
eukprot:scaffold175522_cov21-Tisochrysis_lutea.AAC.1